MDAEGVVERLVEMTKDEEEREEVKSGVVAVLANLVLEFAPMKLVSSSSAIYIERRGKEALTDTLGSWFADVD